MGSVIDRPFGTAVDEVPLSDAPLDLVVAQVRFPPVTSITEPDFVSSFQERLRPAYPVLRSEQKLEMLVGPEGPVQQSVGRIWRFHEHGGPWSVTLATDFLALTTDRYTNRSDFLGRFSDVVGALHDWLHPVVLDRLGIRYVDRISDPARLEELATLIKPEVLGVAAFTHDNDADPVQSHYLAETAFKHADGTELRGRWGLLPAGATFDPSVVPGPSTSWVLDLDAYTTAPKDFDPITIAADAERFCQMAYRFFRWAVTDEFLDRFGAQQ